jgi:hypothetical protein
MIPAGEPLVIQVEYGSRDGSVKDGPRISVPGAGGRRPEGAAVITGSSQLTIIPINALAKGPIRHQLPDCRLMDGVNSNFPVETAWYGIR